MYIFIVIKMLYIFKAMILKIYLFSLYLHDIKQMSRHSFDFIFYRAISRSKTDARSVVSWRYFLNILQSRYFSKKTPIFWHFVCHNCCEKTCDVFGSDSNISKHAVSLTKKQNCTVGINSYNGCQLRIYVSSSLVQEFFNLKSNMN